MARELSRSFAAWFLGSMIFGPLGMIVTFVRVRSLAKKIYGIV
jgi:hypothetical protein